MCRNQMGNSTLRCDPAGEQSPWQGVEKVPFLNQSAETMTTHLPLTMRCIEIARFGEPEVLTLTQRDVPVPQTGEVLIRVAAAGINRPDIMQRKGLYPPPLGVTDIPGLELAGEVVALGPGVTTPGIGSKVCALVAGGAYAEYCTAAAHLCLPVPRGMRLNEAAALPETLFTVWDNLFVRGRLKAGEQLLVHGGSGGIGTMSIQLAKAFGATVFATAGSLEKCRYCEQLGAIAIHYREDDFVAFIRQHTDRNGVDVILDSMGGDYLQRNLDCLATEGRLLLIGLQRGPRTDINLLPILLKRLSLIGSTLRPRTLEEKALIAGALSAKVWPLLDERRIGPVMDRVFPLADAAKAHQRMENSEHIGKMVLTMFE